MLEAGCDGTEVAATLGIHPDTLYNTCERDHKTGFSAYSATKRASGDRLLKVKQFEIAMTGDRTMLVWLGKQRLGQSEKSEFKGDQTNRNVVADMTDEELNAEIDRLERIRKAISD